MADGVEETDATGLESREDSTAFATAASNVIASEFSRILALGDSDESSSAAGAAGGSGGLTPEQVEAVDRVMTLCFAGAKVDGGDLDLEGLTALHLAACSGATAMVVALLEHGADVGRCCKSTGRTPLHTAAVGGNAEVVRLLCAAGAEVDRADSGGMTALYLAVMRGDAHVASALIKGGADESGPGPNGCPLLHEAAIAGHVELVRLLCAAEVEIERRGVLGMTALHMAAGKDRVEVAEVLLEHGADPSASKDPDGESPLHVAAMLGSAKVAKILCSAGAELESLTLASSTALHLASRRGHAGVVSLLCAAGAKVDAADVSGKTPLHLAAAHGRLEAARVLLENAADKNATQADGDTPLHEAAIRGHSDVVRLLCAAGAETATRNANGLPPLAVAVGGLHVDAVSALCDCGADPNMPIVSDPVFTPLMFCAVQGVADVTVALLRGGARVDIARADGKTPLHAAASMNHHDVVEALLQAGANTEARLTTFPCYTALHLACRRGRLESVQALLRAGADETAAERTSRAFTPVAGVDAPGNGRGGVSARTPAAAPAATAIDMIGIGWFALGEDPEQRDGSETDEDYTTRRDLPTIVCIRDALLQATRDRLWGRRRLVVMIKARFEKEARDANSEKGSVRHVEVVPGAAEARVGDRREEGGQDVVSGTNNKDGERPGGRTAKRIRRDPAMVVAAAVIAGMVGGAAGGGIVPAPKGGSHAGKGEVAVSAGGDAGQVVRTGPPGCSACSMPGDGFPVVMERLMGLAGIEEGVFRHVVYFL